MLGFFPFFCLKYLGVFSNLSGITWSITGVPEKKDGSEAIFEGIMAETSQTDEIH